MTDHRSATASLAHPDVDVAWHALTPSEVASRLDVDIASGLTSAQAQERLKQYGPNALAAPKAAPIWKQFLKHYRDYMQIVLVVAAVVSLLIGEIGTFVGLFVLTLFNAWLGYHQEGKAEAAAASLGQMMKTLAKVRRDGEVSEVPAEEIVPGDIVVVDAGDRVPADGRVVLAATLQVESENLSSTISRIRDVDVAQESTQMAKYNILVQSGTAMLAQANQAPASVLKLLDH